MITAPGIYELTNAQYHGDPVACGSLSSTEARTLLVCPARFRYDKDHAETPKRTFEFGNAAHKHVLGVGDDVEVLDFDNYLTKKARVARDVARIEGRTPVLAAEWATVEAMAAAIRQHPIAGRLLTPGAGAAEQSLIWIDPRCKIWRRVRLDWLPNPPASGRMIVADYKTARSAEKTAFARSCAEYGYHCQADWYLDGVRAVCGVTDPAFVFIAQEKTPPYLVNVIELDKVAMTIGRDRNWRSLEIYAECVASGRWPSYSDDVELVSLPRWAEIAHEQEFLLL